MASIKLPHRERYGTASLIRKFELVAGVALVVTRLSLCSPALAEDAASVGIGTCDNFLTAYAQCLQSPGVPSDAKAAIQQGIDNLRDSFRNAAAQGPSARSSIGQQCTSSHEMVRARMIEAFKCEFPAASAMPVVADMPAPEPAPATPMTKAATDPAVEVARKVNAYTKVHNDIVDTHPMGKQLAEHIRNNERVLKLGTKLGANAWYLFGIDDFDRQIADLKEAMALPGLVPEIDPAAAALVSAMETVNPVIQMLYRYQKTRDFKQDGFKLAMAQEKPLEDGMRGVMAASDGFSKALFERRMKIDERRVEAMPAGSLAQTLLSTSLKTRVLLRQYDTLGKPADVPAFVAALDAVRTSNRTLMEVAGAMSPKANSYCAEYSEALDALIGHGRDLAEAVKVKQRSGDASEAIARDYNHSVDYYSKCLKEETRARG